MNQIIQTFSEIAKSKVPPGLVVDQWIIRYNEEFAKLIIEECVSIVNYPAPGCSTSFGDIIKKHFETQ